MESIITALAGHRSRSGIRILPACRGKAAAEGHEQFCWVLGIHPPAWQGPLAIGETDAIFFTRNRSRNRRLTAGIRTLSSQSTVHGELAALKHGDSAPRVR